MVHDDELSLTGTISSTWYRDFLTNPIWKEIKSCRQSEAFLDVRPCEGFLPLQWTYGKCSCDNLAYHCADRADEGDCDGGIKKEENSLVSFSFSKT